MRYDRKALVRGTVEHYIDATLYDFEYRRRRSDIRFYRRLAHRIGGPILELGCGTGRLALPLARDGHQVVGVDLSGSMLARAGARIPRLPRAARQNLLLVRGDMFALPLRRRFPLIIAAFNTLQHVYRSDDLVRLLVDLRRRLAPGGCIAFDVLNPDLDWLVRSSDRRWARTRFKHPDTGEPLVYTTNHEYDPVTQVVMIRIYYDPPEGATGKPRVVRLAHRQYFPEELKTLVANAGLSIAARFGGFGGEPLTGDCESQLLICCRKQDDATITASARGAAAPR